MAIVKVECKSLKNNPHCPHGPTLKFVRAQNGSLLEFFACSAYRDRKDCGFYLAAGDNLTEQVEKVWALKKQQLLESVDHEEAEERLKKVKLQSVKERLYCHTCGQLDSVPGREQHQSHEVQTDISDTLLTHPSKILKPKEGSKKEAQYLFASSTTQVIVDNLRRSGVTRVLCLGAPRVHEYIQASVPDMQSLLLDIDHRYHSFWSPDKFMWFNMFNHHILSADQLAAKRALEGFCENASDSIALIMDPPFGGHVEPLAATVKYFAKLVAKNNHSKILLVIWVFPYFRESHITDKCPSLVMLDYKVQYDNHKEFNNGRKLGSPVRLFTNMALQKFTLPKKEGYRFCSVCSKWVSAENKHCAKCRVCPSKDGRTYTHCDWCGRCVKPQWQHCVTCHKCLPSTHLCAPQDTVNLDKVNEELPHKRRKFMTKKHKRNIHNNDGRRQTNVHYRSNK